eukprot:g948.t1
MEESTRTVLRTTTNLPTPTALSSTVKRPDNTNTVVNTKSDVGTESMTSTTTKSMMPMDSAKRARRIRLKRTRENRSSNPAALVLNRRFSTEGRRTGIRAKENIQKDGQGFDDVDQFLGDNGSRTPNNDNDDPSFDDEDNEYYDYDDDEEDATKTIGPHHAINQSFAANLHDQSADDDNDSYDNDDGNEPSFDLNLSMVGPDGEMEPLEAALTPAPTSENGKRARRVTFSDDAKKRSVEDQRKKQKKKRGPRKKRKSEVEAMRVGEELLLQDRMNREPVRRSKRNRMKPLEFWRGETIEYERSATGLGSMLPTIKRQVKVGAPTPSPPSRRVYKRKKTSTSSASSKVIEKPVKLPKKTKIVECPTVDCPDGRGGTRKTVVYCSASTLKFQKLPTRRKRDRAEPEAMAAPVFNQPAFITGTLKLKPGAYKDNESTVLPINFGSVTYYVLTAGNPHISDHE